jgi:hypothetical protein
MAPETLYVILPLPQHNTTVKQAMPHMCSSISQINVVLDI